MSRFMHSLTRAFVLTALVATVPGIARAQDSEAATSGVTQTPLAAESLSEIPGKKLTAVIVDFAPGAKSKPHRHGGFIFAYVLSGAIRSQLTGGATAVYEAGEHFIEPDGSEHLVSENASSTEPARLLAISVGDEDAELTTLSR
jgi:quercetin dioxygenase-like cupin family protein